MLDGSDVATIADAIASQVVLLAEAVDVTYLVPAVAYVGDRTIESIARQVDVHVQPGRLASLPGIGASTRVIDALELAEAEQARPFDAGMAALDRGVRTLVTNLHGHHVTKLAIDRLQRTYAPIAPNVHIQSRDVLVLDGVGDYGGHWSVGGLLEIVARLRRPDGCPWDREQTPASLLDDLQEEVAEVVAAIGSADWDNLAEELGDVLLHVAMQSQIAAEANRFTFDDIVAGLAAKLVRRHPHVFGDVPATTASDVLSVWQRVKHEEKLAKRRDLR
ncbi:MAG TPA: MazG nucleotide pyrophosphohydrolase domain-containing protein [Thermomicrobiales bacterium]|nr:MazG nucleotide pyrophosphohydrolase domain-containing protein [Thermomicrobiales bacterium]